MPALIEGETGDTISVMKLEPNELLDDATLGLLGDLLDFAGSDTAEIEDLYDFL